MRSEDLKRLQGWQAEAFQEFNKDKIVHLPARRVGGSWLHRLWLLQRLAQLLQLRAHQTQQ